MGAIFVTKASHLVNRTLGRTPLAHLFLTFSLWRLGLFLILVSSWVQADEGDGTPIDFAEASRDVPKPSAIWPIVRQHMVPPEFKVLSDEVVPSDTDPGSGCAR